MPDVSYEETTTHRRVEGRTVIFRTGLLHLLLGSIVFVIGGVAIAYGVVDNLERTYSSMAAGLWCGIVILCAGFIGLVSARKQPESKDWNMGSMVIACVSVFFGLIFLIVTSASLNAALNPMVPHASNISETTTVAPSAGLTTSAPGAKQDGKTNIFVIDAFGIIASFAVLLTSMIQAVSSYQRDPFGLTTLVYAMGRLCLLCCCRKQLQQQSLEYAKEEDFPSDIY